jgi:L-ascorbate metabolism protein UlaG (beta-lactamase superfamily)
MRLKLGRPDLAQYADRFDVPAAEGDFAVTFLGVSTLLLEDGESAVMTDGYFSRPSLAKVGLGKIAPDHDRIDAALARTGATRLAGVLPVHTHFDHALDSAVVAEQTGALLVGGESTANVGRGGGLPQERLRVVSSGESMQLGGFDLTWVESHHCPPDRFPGSITHPVVPPTKAKA